MRARLSDGTKNVDLPLQPEQVALNVTGDYTSNNVLDTNNPVIRRKYSASTYRLGRILLASPTGAVDFSPIINSLRYWTKEQIGLSYTSDIYKSKRCHIKSLTVDVKMWRGSKIVLAELAIELIESIPDPSLRPTAKTAGKPAKKLTPNQQIKQKAKVQTKLKSPTKQKLLALADGFTVDVNDQNQVALVSDGVETVMEYDEFVTKVG